MRVPSRTETILLLAGFCLVVLQFFMVRELTALLKGTELVIVLVTLAYFSGYSVGYGVAGRLTMRHIQALALVTWALHLTLPFSVRYLAGYLSLKTTGMVLVALLFIGAFGLSSFYSVLLPRFIDQATDGSKSLVRYYAFELGGAILGVVALVSLGRVAWLPPLLYQAALAAVVALLWRRWIGWCLAGVALAAYAALFPQADNRSLEYRFATIHKIEKPKILYSANSLYQKVDIVRDAKGKRFIYLNGRMNYGSLTLSRFNLFLSKLPATLVRPRQTLIVGSGSMESVKYASAFSEHITTCELDAEVIAGSRRYLADVNQVDRLSNWTLVLNDAKHFMGSTTQRYDLIIADVPAPTTIQVGLLHSVEFYELARSRLTTNGVMSVSLSGRFTTKNPMPKTVASALLRAFDQVIVYTPREAGRSFALAGSSLPFTPKALRDAGIALGASEVRIYERAEVVSRVGGTPPISANDLRFVVLRSWKHLGEL